MNIVEELKDCLTTDKKEDSKEQEDIPMNDILQVNRLKIKQIEESK